MTLEEQIKLILPRVEKPTRYLGNEWNMVHKDHGEVDVSIALAFPDLYEVGMSNLGFKILYAVVNQEEGLVAERVFAPASDMEKYMREGRLPLFSLETFTPLNKFHIIGFTLQHELSYTNILNMLNLAGIPLHQCQRGNGHPLIIAGGPGAFNPEPLASFFDCFVLGDGEEVILEIMETYRRWQKERRRSRKELLGYLARLPGVYVPSFYRPYYDRQGKFAGIEPLSEELPEKIKKRMVMDLEKAVYPTNPVVPFMEVVHDRGMLELFRGCTRGCRFCQAGIIYRPVRERSPEWLREKAQELVDQTGYEEISLTSLSSTDYSHIAELVEELQAGEGKQGLNISLPSLRVDSFSVQLAKRIQKMRKSGLTFAPEAGTQRLRDVINKNVTEEDLLKAIREAFKEGWHNIKLYFMIGLPTERFEDVKGIGKLACKALSAYKEYGTNKAKPRVTVSTSTFVPKPHTPFQWEPLISIEEIRRRQAYLRDYFQSRPGLRYEWHGPEMTFIEAVFSRGDRRLGKVLETAWQNGCLFDSWTENFRFDRWMRSFEAMKVQPNSIACARFDYNDPLPWDHLDAGVSKEFLIREHRRALAGRPTPDCRDGLCQGCGLQCSLQKEEGNEASENMFP